MKIIKQKTKNHKTLVIISIVSVIVLIAFGVWYVYKANLFGWNSRSVPAYNPSINYTPPTSAQLASGAATKAASASSGTTGSAVAKPSAQKTNVDVSVSSKNPTNDGVRINFLINAITNDGTCTITLTNPSATTVTKTVNVQAEASSTTCEGFNIALPSGTWNYTLNFTSATLTGTNSGSLTVN